MAGAQQKREDAGQSMAHGHVRQTDASSKIYKATGSCIALAPVSEATAARPSSTSWRVMLVRVFIAVAAVFAQNQVDSA